MEDSSYWPLDLDLGGFPPAGCVCVIGYGSGVFRQLGYTGARPMVDLVFVVSDADVASWHRGNLRMNAEHYSGLLRMLGPRAVTRVQGWGPGILYNPHVSLATRDGGTVEAKYGVMSVQSLLRDLTEWDSLYMAGRLHKPCVLEHHGQSGQEYARIEGAIVRNRRAALSAALLDIGWRSKPQAPLNLYTLLSSIVGLSYVGDVRVGIAEDPKKVSNIVLAQQRKLWDIYQPLAAELGLEVGAGVPGQGACQARLGFDFSAAARQRLFGELPPAIQGRVAAAGHRAPWEDRDALRGALREVVRRSSAAQTAKGLLTAGAARGARYAVQKLRKRFK
mmetsp:Transcript_58919/g.166168  ORF Transcript_58919/g.166168 Transcript_58919/m.166168 type:complete len:334 (-) Transcript_58919:32-1033(-)